MKADDVDWRAVFIRWWRPFEDCVYFFKKAIDIIKLASSLFMVLPTIKPALKLAACLSLIPRISHHPVFYHLQYAYMEGKA